MMGLAVAFGVIRNATTGGTSADEAQMCLYEGVHNQAKKLRFRYSKLTTADWEDLASSAFIRLHHYMSVGNRAPESDEKAEALISLTLRRMALDKLDKSSRRREVDLKECDGEDAAQPELPAPPMNNDLVGELERLLERHKLLPSERFPIRGRENANWSWLRFWKEFRNFVSANCRFEMGQSEFVLALGELKAIALGQTSVKELASKVEVTKRAEHRTVTNRINKRHNRCRKSVERGLTSIWKACSIKDATNYNEAFETFKTAIDAFKAAGFAERLEVAESPDISKWVQPPREEDVLQAALAVLEGSPSTSDTLFWFEWLSKVALRMRAESLKSQQQPS